MGFRWAKEQQSPPATCAPAGGGDVAGRRDGHGRSRSRSTLPADERPAAREGQASAAEPELVSELAEPPNHPRWGCARARCADLGRRRGRGFSSAWGELRRRESRWWESWAVASLEPKAAKQAGGLVIDSWILLILVLLLWLSLDEARPNGSQRTLTPVALEHARESSRASPNDWIGEATWEHKDARVRCGRHPSPGRLTGPKDAKHIERQYLRLRLRVANAGVEREISLSGWATGQGAEAVRVIDPTGKALKPATFEETLQPDRGKPSDRLFPGKASEPHLIFVAPSGKVDWLRVQLPGSAFGMSEEIRFQIGSGFLSRNAAP